MKTKFLAQALIIVAGLNLAVAVTVLATETPGPCQAGATVVAPTGAPLVGGGSSSSAALPAVSAAEPSAP